jgi:phytoene/squalene synthetase
MIQLYNKTSSEISKEITKSYSTSFSLGIRLFAQEYREPIYNIYGFVRIADEIVDTFFEHDRKYLLDKFKFDTIEAIKSGISTNPVLHSFQRTVNEYNIDFELIDSFLKSMEMDLVKTSYENYEYNSYVYGSAEAVGLMCLKIFTKNSPELFDNLKPYAQKLGSAFQKVNFLRDVKSDIETRGRIYFPDINNINQLDIVLKEKFEADIENEFNESLKGILKLPMGVRLGVFVAYIYYKTLFNKLKRKSIQEIRDSRISVPNVTKLCLLIKSYFVIRFLKSNTIL